MAKAINGGLVAKSKITTKGLAVVFVLALLAAFTAIFLNNNVPQVAAVTKQQGGAWYDPRNWFK